jgi:hypothetical protein
MLQREPHIPVDDLGRISAPTLVVMGDDDLMSVEHSAALFRAIPNSELAVVPGASHAVVIEKPELLNRIVLDFLENEPVPTMMPVRRPRPVRRCSSRTGGLAAAFRASDAAGPISPERATYQDASSIAHGFMRMILLPTTRSTAPLSQPDSSDASHATTGDGFEGRAVPSRGVGGVTCLPGTTSSSASSVL